MWLLDRYRAREIFFFVSHVSRRRKNFNYNLRVGSNSKVDLSVSKNECLLTFYV